MDGESVWGIGSTYISLLALFVALLSLVVSFLALARDTHKVKAYSHGLLGLGTPRGIAVVVRNHGKRPITIKRILISRREENGDILITPFPFSDAGERRLDVGESATATLESEKVRFDWKNFERLTDFKVQVEDALGQVHSAPYVGVAPPVRGV